MNINKRVETLLKELTLDEKISLCTGKNFWQTRNIDRLGIPSITMSDGTNGVRFQKGSSSEERLPFRELIRGSFDTKEALDNTYPATCYPTGSAIACSWNRELIHNVGSAIAKECKLLGIDLLLGPGINTRRYPLTARNYEYYSEDPCLAGDMAAAIIDGIQEEGVGTSLKHFACHNSDSYRTRVDVRVDEQAFREIYLACFERAIKKANPLTVMSAYNKINGKEASGNSPLVKDILKGEWNYDGSVICDWGGIKNVIEATKGEIDLQMPYCASSAVRLKKAVEQGEIGKDLLDQRVAKVLNMVFRLQEMKQSPKDIDWTRHHALAAQAAAESAVLLKNEDDILPLKREGLKKLAVIGYLAKEPVFQGSGCAIVNAKEVDEPLACILKECNKQVVEVNYASGYNEHDEVTTESLEEAVALAAAADVVLLFAGNKCPEESDDYNRKDIRIEDGHQKLLEAAAEVNKNIVVILSSGEVLEMPWIHQVKGVLEMWYGGEGSGKAVSDIIFGHENPSGKLSSTIPVKLEDCPSYLGFTDHVFEVDYSEGIYVGYRYFDKKGLAPRFPFGYGLSYTKFSYNNLQLSQISVNDPNEIGDVTVSVDITNTGSRKGQEVVQLYIGQPHHRCPRPVRELKGFEKIKLNVGETKTVTFSLTRRDLAYYDVTSKRFVVDADIFTIEVGASSRDIRLFDTLQVNTTDRPKEKLRLDCGFLELFGNEDDKAAFDKFLEETGVVEPGEVDEQMHSRMSNSFWAISSYLDMNAGADVTWEMFETFINQRNQTRS